MRVFLGRYPQGEKERKVNIRIDNYDLWSMDHTLSLIILPMLKKLKEIKHGSPYVDIEDAPHIGKGEETDFGYSDDKIHDRWEWVLDEIIWAHEQVVDDDDNNYNIYYDPYEPDEPLEPLMKFTVLNDDHTTHEENAIWDTEDSRRKMGKFNAEKYKAYNDRINNGLTLFGKYYRGLWD